MPIRNPSSIIAEDVLVWVINGPLAPGIEQDDARAVRLDGIIRGVIVTAGQKGDTGTALFDINKHVPTKPITTQRDNTAPVTIYTTQANRPSIVGDSATKTQNAIKQAADPDVTSFSAGDFFTVDVDDIGGGSNQDIVIHLYVEFS